MGRLSRDFAVTRVTVDDAGDVHTDTRADTVTVDAIGKHLIEAAAVSAAADSTGFDQGKKKLVSMDNLPQVQSTEKPDDKLQAELQKQLRGKRGGKG